MRWPFRKHPPGAAPLPQPDQPPPGAVTTAAERAPELHPDRSRPRTDWAHLTRLEVATAAAPPLTFHGERFGRSVSGARSLVGRVGEPRRSTHAPAGLLHDVVQVDAIVPAPPAETPAAGLPNGAAEPAVAALAVAVHRKRTVAPAGVQRLVEADGPDTAWSPAPARVQRLEAAAESWTLDDGFLTEPASGATRRVVRRRDPRAAEATAAAETELDERDELDEAGTEIEPPRVPELRYVPVPGRRTEREVPPADIVVVVAAATGVHVGDAVIDRSPETTAQADDMGALAFTRHGVVHLPAELGPLDAPDVKAVVAHELTHVAQHRMRAGDIPPEDTDAGQALEAEAQAVQRAIHPGAPVVPTFRRPRPERREGPVGVQRATIASARGLFYEGTDFSDYDFSTDDPEAHDIFAWQARQGEPTEQPWPERKEWARREELSKSRALQQIRDHRYHELLEPRGRERTEAHIAEARQQLDEEFPYQFGGPHDIEPYPEVVIPEEEHPETPTNGSGAHTGTAPPTGGGVQTHGARGAGGGPAAVTAPDALAVAMSDISRRELRTMDVAADRAPRRSIVDLVTPEDDDRWLEERRTRERELRIQLLNAKRGEATREDADAGRVIPLTRAEIDAIRGVVDEEFPREGVDVGFLDDDDHGSVTAGGAFGGFVEEDSARAAPAHRRAGGATPPMGGTASARSTSPTHSMPPTPTNGSRPGEHPDEYVTHLADDLLRTLRTSTDAVDSRDALQLTEQELLNLQSRRLRDEIRFREQLLHAKRNDLGELSRYPDDFVIALTSQELQTIVAAIDEMYPQIAGIGMYNGDDVATSLPLRGDRSGGFLSDPETPDAARQRHARETDRAQDREGEHGQAPTPPGGPPTLATPPAATAPAAPPPPGAPAQLEGVPGTEHGARDGGGHPGALATAPAPPVTAATATPAHDDDPNGTAERAHLVESLNDLDLDRLTRRLWSRMRRELRGELLIDRERAGALADMR